MKKITLLLLIAVGVLSSSLADAEDRLYIWKDDKGIPWLTDYPPPDLNMIIKSASFVPADPREVAAAREKQRRAMAELERQGNLKKWQSDAEEIKKTIQANAIESAKKRGAQLQENLAEIKKQQQTDNNHQLRQLRLRKEQVQHEYDNARSEYYRSFWLQRLNDVKYEESRLRDQQ